MGAANSKEEPVYVYGKDIPIGFSRQLGEKLVKKAQEESVETKPVAPVAAPLASSTATARELTEKTEELVAKELERILEKQQIEDQKACERQASTTELLNEIRDITRQINASPSTRSPAFALSLRARDRVAACLIDNAGRPLDCWAEVAEFKALADTLQTEFAAGSR
ncbi:hypothetical protein GGI07_004297 [Coemansia sp. Benny D115]|nr:hypothetical protein GGI07_004297 [Coemansia sp. Benny D115]